MILATICYIRRHNQTLMLHRVKKENDLHAGKWNGVGGKVEKGESPEVCTLREIKEETGLTAKKLILKGILTFPEFDTEKNDWYVFVFICNKFSGKLIDSPEGNLEWVNNSKLLDLNLWEGDKIFLPWLEKNKFFSAKFIYKNSQFINHEVVFY